MEIWIRCGTDIFDYVQVYENSQSHIRNERGLCWFSDSNRIDIAHPNGMRLLLLNFLEHFFYSTYPPGSLSHLTSPYSDINHLINNSVDFFEL